MNKRLYRSRTNRMILGVCNGLAEYFNIDPTIVRLIAVLALFIGFFPAVIAYIILAIVVPLEGSTAKQPEETVRENVQEMKQSAAEIGKEIQSTFNKEATKESSAADSYHRSVSILGIGIIAIGIICLIVTFGGWWAWLRWEFIPPVILIIIGLLIIFVRRRK